MIELAFWLVVCLIIIVFGGAFVLLEARTPQIKVARKLPWPALSDDEMARRNANARREDVMVAFAGVAFVLIVGVFVYLGSA